MLKLLTENVELRGITNVVSKKGNTYVRLNVETVQGEPYYFLCKDASVVPDGLSKGYIISLVFDYDQRWNRFTVVEIKKVG